jgi:two-component system sensor histidine kinase TctE
MTPSIRVDLLKWLIAPLLVINLIGALLIYVLAWTPAQIAFDQSLSDAAYDLAPHIRVTAARVELDLSEQAERMLRANHFDAVYYVVRDAGGRTLAGDHDFPSLFYPGKENDPLAYSGQIRNDPVRIIVLKVVVDAEPVWIGVAETLSKRRGIQGRILLTLLILEAVLVVASVAIVWFAVREGLFPLQKMQVELDARNPGDLSAIDEKELPEELRPLIGAINGLLNRAQTNGKARQNFLANVAHQLRTPLAGFKAQLELLQQKYAGEKETTQSVNLMLSSTERMVRQTNQLLALARAEPSQFEKQRLEIVELDKLMEESIQHFVREADKKAIDIGFDLRPAKVMGDRFLLRDLIDNLVDNAIRYSPHGGLVTVRCMQHENRDAGRIVVEDCGSGVPPAEREKIFNRFYRLDDKVAGSGLGLAIVRDIAKDHDAQIILESGADGKGTVFTVQFPPI